MGIFEFQNSGYPGANLSINQFRPFCIWGGDGKIGKISEPFLAITDKLFNFPHFPTSCDLRLLNQDHIAPKIEYSARF